MTAPAIQALLLFLLVSTEFKVEGDVGVSVEGLDVDVVDAESDAAGLHGQHLLCIVTLRRGLYYF